MSHSRTTSGYFSSSESATSELPPPSSAGHSSIDLQGAAAGSSNTVRRKPVFVGNDREHEHDSEPDSPIIRTPPDISSPTMPNMMNFSGPPAQRRMPYSRLHSQAQSRVSLKHIRDRPATYRKPYKSTKLEGEISKPWLAFPDPAHRWGKIIFWALFAVGVAAAGVLCYFGYSSVPNPGNLCLVMDDNFSNGISSDHWTHEVRTDGYGNGQFEWTTASTNNSFTENNVLYLVPTLTSDSIGTDAVSNGYTLNLTAQGICTQPNATDCVARSNSSVGTVINPVQGVRLTTKGKANIKYGKVEVTARMPIGDWIWPAIWMMPENSQYGVWPQSGEIDIMESRGNNYTYRQGGNNQAQTALHWGPAANFDQYYRTFGTRKSAATTAYTSQFNKFTLEWTDKYIWTYINNKVYSVYQINFDQSFWNRGKFPSYYQNGTDTIKINNPWYQSENNAAPFDQSFYLILDIAVGGTNGFFPDNMGGKPWLDSSANAMSDFWAAKDKWYSTWPQDKKQRGMAVSSVKMWQKC